MELSEALLSGKLKFAIESNGNGGKRYMPFASQSQEYELSIACPIFVESGIQEPQEIAANLPDGVLPKKIGIYFLADAIDKLSVQMNWDEKRVGELVAKIEADLDAAGKNRRGIPK